VLILLYLKTRGTVCFAVTPGVRMDDRNNGSWVALGIVTVNLYDKGRDEGIIY